MSQDDSEMVCSLDSAEETDDDDFSMFMEEDSGEAYKCQIEERVETSLEEFNKESDR